MADRDLTEVSRQLSDAHARGDYAGMEILLRNLVAASPLIVKLRLTWGDTLLALKRFGEAELVFRQAICIRPDIPEVWLKHRDALLADQRPDDATSALAKAVDLDPYNPRTLVAYAKSLAAAGKEDAAETILLRSVAIDPSKGETHYLLARLSLRFQRSDGLSRSIYAALHLGHPISSGKYQAFCKFLTDVGKESEAIDLLGLALKRAPLTPGLHMAMAIARAQLAVKQAGVSRSSETILPVCPAFVPMSMGYGDRQTSPEHTPPFRIFAQLSTMSFAGFIGSHVFAATIKQQFRHAHLTVFYRPDRPFKDDIMALNPYVDVVLRPKESELLALDYFEQDYATYAQPQVNPMRQWYDRRQDWVDFMITSSMMSDIRLMGFDHVAKLKVPDARVAELSDKLVELGLDPNRWFCVLHYREPSWTYVRENWLRDGNPKTFEDVVHRIIRDLGGQVVRLGHKGMTPFAPVPGFVDLSHHSTLLQAFAVSRARFLLNGSSGPTLLACAFGVPVLAVNAADIWHGWGKGNSILAQHLFTKDGQRISPRRATQNELISTQALTYLVKECGYRVVQNSADEIMAGVRPIAAENAHVNGWREQRDEPPPPPPNRIVWPPPIGMPWKILDFPELAPAGPVLD